MRRIARLLPTLCCACAALAGVQPLAAAPEYNPIPRRPVSIGPEASRLIIGFRSTAANAVTATIAVRRSQQSFHITQAQSSAADVDALAGRVGVALAASRQVTPSVHVLMLRQRLYGADVIRALEKLRADPAVEFAVIDRHRYALAQPDDPLFARTPGTASGQWYLQTPSDTILTLDNGVQTTDLAAVDAVSAWNITTGSNGVVIADVDTGILFEHPDLLRAGLGGRLLPGYDFVGEDYDPSNGAPLGTYLIANDGDGWDPDPSDPGDWISSSDLDNSLFSSDQAESSSWHGTRVVGIFGAMTNNGIGIAGATWSSWILPIRALGKGGGYDSDIIAGMEWAAGLPVTDPDGAPVAGNPYSADIVNLSIGGGTDTCSSQDGAAYQTALNLVTQAGVLVVIAAGNGTGAPVELPANCAGTVVGVMAVAGVRNVGTKVGFSSIGPEVSVAAPAGNCVETGGLCLRSIDTTTNLGTTVPGANTYTDESNPNLGTSFAAPIVSGIAGLMRAVNGNLSPAQLAARIKSSVMPFPANSGNLPVCPALASDGSDQCSCLGSGQCGAGMVNAYQAVLAAEHPIAAVAIPVWGAGAAEATLDAGSSAAACGRTIASYSWQAGGAVTIVSGAAESKVVIELGSGSLKLIVTDDHGDSDSATVSVTSLRGSSSAPASAGSAACPKVIDVAPTPPTAALAFSPATTTPTTAATLVFTLANANPFALTETQFSASLPSGLSIPKAPAPVTTCTGASTALSTSSDTVSLTHATVPPRGSCSVSVSVSSGTVGSYTSSVAAGALVTGPAGSNITPASATLTVKAAPPPAHGGGGEVDKWDLLGVAAALLIVRRRAGGRGSR